MARAAADSDVFNAIAEPRRRAILELVCHGEHAVNEVVEALEMDQPSVSKHLRVLREVNLLRMRKDGRRHLYSVDPDALSTVRRWVERCERIWEEHLDSIKRRAEARSSTSRPENEPDSMENEQ